MSIVVRVRTEKENPMSDTCVPIRNELSALRARRREQAQLRDVGRHLARRRTPHGLPPVTLTQDVFVKLGNAVDGMGSVQSVPGVGVAMVFRSGAWACVHRGSGAWVVA
jgi:hypothetical protein